MQWLKLILYHLSAENYVKCDRMCVFHIHSLQTTDVHIARGFRQLERRSVPLSFGIKQYVFGLASFYDSSSKFGNFEQKRWPGTGSFPKTAGSQSVK